MKIGVIGSGCMASALLSGFISSNKVLPNEIYLSDLDTSKLLPWKEKGVNCFNSNSLVVENSDIIIFAVKPNVLPMVLNEIGKVAEDKVFVSIAAGFPIERIEKYIGRETKIIRAMPNTPALVKCGMTVICPNENVSKNDIKNVTDLFSAVGEVIDIEEKFINVATALHGSSPAYVYMLIDAMADSGVKYGLKKETALLLAAKAVEGSAKMVLETDEHIMKLKDNVCSPGGTTIEAVATLEECGFKSTIQRAIDSCINKANNM